MVPTVPCDNYPSNICSENICDVKFCIPSKCIPYYDENSKLFQAIHCKVIQRPACFPVINSQYISLLTIARDLFTLHVTAGFIF